MLTNLIKLNLRYNTCITDSGIITLIKLRSLTLIENTKITDNGMLSLTKLKTLVLDNLRVHQMKDSQYKVLIYTL